MSVSLSSTDLDAIRQLLKIVTDNQLAELSISLRDGVAITIKTAHSQAPAPTVAYLPPPQAVLTGPSTGTPALSAPAAATGAAPSKRGTPVGSPMVGIFYHAGSPGDPPFVKIGDVVSVGQTIGLIEAMKVFSEVPSDAAGRVVEIVVENGELVQLGQPLIYLEPA